MLSERAKRAGLKELEIFDYFEIDRNLPKHYVEGNAEKNSLNSINGGFVTFGTTASGGNEAWMDVPQTPPIPQIRLNADGTYSYDGSITRREKFVRWLFRIANGKNKSKANVKRITIVEFFTQLSKSYEELTPIAEIAEYYENALIQAKAMGQTALLEKLKDGVDVVRGEAHLIAMGLTKHVTEKQIISLYEKVGADKNLKLTWIKNFGRIIPESVYEIKKDVDERKIFDNYVVLQYDPKDNGEKLTKKEIEKKKDPILFGLIKNSKKLYYIADWKDEYCDLTLEEMFKILKSKVLQINNKSVKTYISKIKA